MNKRIEELAYKTHLSWCIQNDFDQKNIQEFAELIIKECCDLLPGECQSKDGCHAGWTIEEHFGIKD